MHTTKQVKELLRKMYNAHVRGRKLPDKVLAEIEHVITTPSDAPAPLFFLRARNLKELKKAVATRKWEMSTEIFDAGKSDYIEVRFTHKGTFGKFLVNPMNGRFFGSYAGPGRDSIDFNSDDTKLEKCAWFVSCLNCCLVPKP